MPIFRPSRSVTSCVLLCVALASSAAAAEGESYRLEEPAGRSAVWRVETRLNVRGELRTPEPGGKLRPLPLKVDANLRYLERRLPGAGRDAESLRSLRQYERAEADITVDGDRTASKLSEGDRGIGDRVIVAHGRREGLQFYSPDAHLTTAEIELLHTPGDGLAVLGLLPPRAVEVGDSWTPETWVLQTLTGTEALLKGDMTCRLMSVEDGRASVSFDGQTEGAVDGTTTQITLSGRYVFDLNQKYVRHVELTQTEERTVGPVSPGMQVTASAVVDRAPSPHQGRLTDGRAEAIPLEPTADMLKVSLRTAGGLTLLHGREWKVFHQSGRFAVLRWVENGEMIAQCNINVLDATTPGTHITERQFDADIRKALGEQLEKFTAAAPVPTGLGRFIYRVEAVGKVKNLDMTWRYYLVANLAGHQAALVFSFETDLAERLGNADRELAESLQFSTADTPKLSGRAVE
jgi:hypothetical protein